MALKFSANISTMFTEYPLEDRFEKARECGFNSVEIQFPYETEIETLREKKGNIQCDLINIYCDSSKYGCASMPLHENEFFLATQRVMPYYYGLGFKKLHILSGVKSEKCTKSEQMNTFIETLNSLVSSDYLENINVTALIEPICEDVIGNYFLNSFDMAVDIIKQVDSDQVKLLLDVYHLHKLTGDVKKNLEIYYPYAGHIQISQHPGRCEPFHPDGEIDYNHVLKFLAEKKHTDYIGLEYFPSGSTVDSLSWMKDWI